MPTELSSVERGGGSSGDADRATPTILPARPGKPPPSFLPWDREIAPGYAASAEGRAAPLLRVDIDGPWPDGIVLDRRPVITPTFVLLRDGAELKRLEGYPGDTFFYPVLNGIMKDAGVAPGGKESE